MTTRGTHTHTYTVRRCPRYFDTDNDGQLQVPDLLATGFLNPREARGNLLFKSMSGAEV